MLKLCSPAKPHKDILKSLRSILLAFGLAALMNPLSLTAADYAYDEKHSKVLFTMRHLGQITLEGHFKQFKGSFQFDPNAIEKSQVHLVIQTMSLDSQNKKQNEKLRGKNFFWAEKFPEITFESQKITDVNGEQFKIHGDLTIRGITRPVVFDTELCCEVQDSGGQNRLLFNTHTHIKRSDFQLGTGGLLMAAEWLGRESLQINLEVKGIPTEEAV